jgi:hypothetical protein
VSISGKWVQTLWDGGEGERERKRERELNTVKCSVLKMEQILPFAIDELEVHYAKKNEPSTKKYYIISHVES